MSETDVAPVSYPDLGPGVIGDGAPELDRIADVALTVTVELGRTRMSLRDLLRLQDGSVVELDRAPDAPVDILVNGTKVARGEVVVVGDELGIRIIDLLRRG
jgi:flagellar motor switch protein FliN